MNFIPVSFRHRQYVIFWFGLCFAWLGYISGLRAIDWHINALTNGDSAALGFTGIVRFVPLLLVSLFAGITADRFNRRNLMFVSQGTMGAIFIVLGLLTYQGAVALWQIYALLALHAIAFTFDLPARQSMVPNLVPRKDQPNAFTTQIIAFHIGAALGPISIGYVLKNLGQYQAYLLCGASFFIMLILLSMVGPVKQEKLARNGRGLDVGAIREGIQYTFSHPLILSSMLLDFFTMFFVRGDNQFPIIALQVLKLDAVAFGWLGSAQAIGAATTGIILTFFKNIPRQGLVLTFSFVLIGVGAILFGLSRNFYLSMFALMLMGAADSVSAIIRNMIRQMLTPDNLRGRIVSVNQIFFAGGPQLGEYKTGLLAGSIGVPAAIVMGGVGAILATGAINLKWKQLIRFDGDE